ncbi:glycine cleavage system aminomethyltransferase GcvT [Parasphingopyxis algicola]|uniref:glycine cleavage system aminomethyltransferase GcvT n=1 Tax=Parasphingopyxis algicola TaxID=2026624 RepID=UPI0015A287D9|nr:glycine cleavage system aminomethyltransferase GcvT [Parasphingopyxis algicola]QLC24495.1 glycine cleavage system aminomethyltransferase GcvT [Parasphingopyxis algicola]
MGDDAKLPLDNWHRAQGARMVGFAGYAMPIQYEGIMAEHLWTRESAGLFDVSHMGQLIVSGREAAKALETVLPGEIRKLGAERMRYSLLLAPDGGIVDDLMVTRLADAGPESFGLAEGEAPDADGEYFYLVVNGATKHGDIAYLRETLPDDIHIRHLEGRALLALQGPKAGTALARLVPDTASLYFMQAGGFIWSRDAGDVGLWISRSGYTGEDGFEISVAAGHAEALAEALAGQAEVKPVGLGARDSLRLEAGLPLYGHDIDTETTPVEADLGFALSKRRREAADFPGAARILAQRENGADRKRVGLTIEGRQPVREGATVVNGDDNAAGKVTSGGFSPSLQQPIAMAYVPAGDTAPGTVITLEQRGKPFTGTVTPMPFVPHRYHRQPKQ